MPLSLNRQPRYCARKPRYRVAFETSIRTADGKETPVLVRDLSDEGFMAVATTKLEAGMNISLDLPDLGRVEATVRWTEDGCIGAQFAASLPAFPSPTHLDRRKGPRAEFPSLNLLREQFAAQRQDPPAEAAE